jgi:hypothetical protein
MASGGSWKERRRFERGARDADELDGLYRDLPVPRFVTVVAISEEFLPRSGRRELSRILRSPEA